MIAPPTLRLSSRCLSLLLVLAACEGDDESDDDSGIAEDGGSEDALDGGSMEGGRTEAGLEDDGGSMEDAASDPDAEADAAIDGGGMAGARLVWIGYQVDGTAAGTEIYDTELQARCDWMVTSEPDASNETLHCVPTGFGEMLYRDPDCTEPIARIRNVDSAPCAGSPLDTGSIVRLAGPAQCGGSLLTVHELGDELELDTVYRIPYGQETCVEDSPSGASFYEALPAPYDQLVSARIEIEPTSDPELELEIIAADDGSRFHRWLRWADGESCEPVPTDSSGQVRPCVPRSAIRATVNTYLDSACTEPIFTGTVDSACDVQPEWQWGLVSTPVDGCERVSGLFELGDPITDFYVGPPDSCVEGTNPLPDDWRSFAGDAERALSSVPQTTRAWVGTGRIRREHIAAEDGTPITPVLGFRDEELELECYPREFVDGTVRCFAGDFFGEQGYYADEDCTEPAYVTFVGGCNPSADAPRVRAEQEEAPSGCGSVISAVVSLMRHTAPVYRNDDGCVEATLDPSEAAYVDGASIDPSEYAEITVVEP